MRAAIDTGALLALANPRDQYHEAARKVARDFVARGGRFVGTTLVLAELHGHLVRRLSPVDAADLLRLTRADRVYDWRDVGTEMVDAALNDWIGRFRDQRFSLTDAVTFELMKRERLTDAFAFDDHFRVAGFRLLT
jgi:predicted nucleic acid-binding protein